MKKILSIRHFRKPLIIAILLCAFMGCANKNHSGAKKSIEQNHTSRMTVLGFDISKSVASFREQDTAFVGSVCRLNENVNQIIVAYSIGNPNDLSGLRCYLKAVPKISANETLSKQAEEKHIAKLVRQENEKAISAFLKQIHEQYFGTTSAESKTANTDLDGFFKKVSILLNEPQSKGMQQFVYCYSDGIHSLNNNDKPSTFVPERGCNVTLCLVGWKTRPPCKTVPVLYFEDPKGFLRYIEHQS